MVFENVPSGVGRWKYWLFSLLLLDAAVSLCHAAPATASGALFKVENAFVKATIDGAHGAALVSFIDKTTGSNLLSAPSFADINLLPGERIQDLGDLAFDLVSDTVPASGEQTDCRNGGQNPMLEARFVARLPRPPALAPEHLIGRAWDPISRYPLEVLKRQPLEAVKLTKTYRLSADSPVLSVEYRLDNSADEVLQVCLGTVVAPAGNRLYIPTSEGPLAIPVPLVDTPPHRFPRVFADNPTYLYDLPEVWAANFDGSGTGVVMHFNPARVSFLRVDVKNNLITVGGTRARIPPRGAFSTRAWLMPVSGLAHVHGAADGEYAMCWEVAPSNCDYVASLYGKTYLDSIHETATPPTLASKPSETLQSADDLPAELMRDDAQTSPVNVSARFVLVSGHSRDVEVVFSLHPNLSDQIRQLGSETRRLSAAKASVFILDLPSLKAGTFILHADVREAGQTVARFERAIICGRPVGFHFCSASPCKEGEVNEDFRYAHLPRPLQPIAWDWTPSLSVTNQHVPLARPLSGGPIKVLAAVPYANSREIVELAQRIDLEYDVLVEGLTGYSMEAGAIAPQYEVDRLKRLLNKRHEAIILGLFHGQRFPAGLTEEIVRQVEEEGVGLVVCVGRHMTGALDQWHKKAEPDSDLLPGSRARIANPGKGRVAFFDAPHGAVPQYWISGRQDLNEHDFDDFARVLLWAARGAQRLALEPTEIPRVVTRLEFSAKPLVIGLQNNGANSFSGRVTAVFRKDVVAENPTYGLQPLERRICPSWEEWGRLEQLVSAESRQRVSVVLQPPVLPAGEYSLGLTVQDSERKIVMWRRHPVRIESAFAISEIIVAHKSGLQTQVSFSNDVNAGDLSLENMKKWVFVAEPDEILQIDCIVNRRESGKAENEPLFCKIAAQDPWGRIIYTNEVPDNMQSSSVQGENMGVSRCFSFALPVRGACHRLLEVRVNLHDGIGCLDERRLLGLVSQRPEKTPAFAWLAYSPDSDLRPEVTGYDSRYRSAITMQDILRHAWCNMNMSGLFEGVPAATTILMPGDQAPAPVSYPSVLAPNSRSNDEAVSSLACSANLEDGYIRVPCLLNPGWRENALRTHEAYFRSRSFFCRPFNATMGDEFYYTKELVNPNDLSSFRRNFILCRDGNICRCPYCLQAFREHVRRIYDNQIERLNEEWQTKHQSWSEVSPPLLSTNCLRAAANGRAAGIQSGGAACEGCPPEEHWPRIIDHRRFIDWQVARLIADIRDAARHGSPSSKLGWGDLMGDTSIWNGLDACLVSPLMDFNALDHEINIWQSLGHVNNIHFVGYSKQYSPIRESITPWSMLFAGMTGIANWNSPQYPRHRSDHTFFESAEVIFAAMREIRENGLDRLLVSHRRYDPVGILYDPASIYVSELEEWQEDEHSFHKNMAVASREHADKCKRIEQTWANALDGRHLQYYTVGYADLEQGRFGKVERPRLIILPYTQCLSDKQARTLRQFVSEGGTIVGDVHTGFRDEHGKRLAVGRLNDVFGLQHVSSNDRLSPEVERGLTATLRLSGCGGEGFPIPVEAIGPGDIAPTSGKPHANTVANGQSRPALIVNDFGKGKAVYLNFLPLAWMDVSVRPPAAACTTNDVITNVSPELADVSIARTSVSPPSSQEGFRRMLDFVLRLADVAEPLSCDGDITLHRFCEGRNEYIGVCADYKSPDQWFGEYRIKTPGSRHIYDVRERTYLGVTNTIVAKFNANEMKTAALYALLPYKVEGIRLVFGADAIFRGERLSFAAQILPFDVIGQRHVLSVRVINSQGQDLPWYRACLETTNGLATGHLDTAVNDLAGKWQITVVDVATGTRTNGFFTVK